MSAGLICLFTKIKFHFRSQIKFQNNFNNKNFPIYLLFIYGRNIFGLVILYTVEMHIKGKNALFSLFPNAFLHMFKFQSKFEWLFDISETYMDIFIDVWTNQLLSDTKYVNVVLKINQLYFLWKCVIHNNGVGGGNYSKSVKIDTFRHFLLR